MAIDTRVGHWSFGRRDETPESSLKRQRRGSRCPALALQASRVCPAGPLTGPPLRQVRSAGLLRGEDGDFPPVPQQRLQDLDEAVELLRLLNVGVGPGRVHLL